MGKGCEEMIYWEAFTLYLHVLVVLYFCFITSVNFFNHLKTLINIYLLEKSKVLILCVNIIYINPLSLPLTLERVSLTFLL